jgi:uncharacterized membrane protein HdeD (DUF308 family)
MNYTNILLGSTVFCLFFGVVFLLIGSITIRVKYKIDPKNGNQEDEKRRKQIDNKKQKNAIIFLIIGGVLLTVGIILGIIEYKIKN